jgi:hypothetical protein
VAVTGAVADQRGLLRAAVLATVTTVLAGVFSTLAERARSTAGTLAVLGAGQLALHYLIELLNPSHVAHHLAGAADAGSGGTGMLAMHAGATLLTAAALRYADRAIAVVRAALGRVLPRRPPVLSADRPLASRVTPGAAVSLRLARALAAAQVRRGPPVGC